MAVYEDHVVFKSAGIERKAYSVKEGRSLHAAAASLRVYSEAVQNLQVELLACTKSGTQNRSLLKRLSLSHHMCAWYHVYIYIYMYICIYIYIYTYTYAYVCFMHVHLAMAPSPNSCVCAMCNAVARDDLKGRCKTAKLKMNGTIGDLKSRLVEHCFQKLDEDIS